MQIALTPAQYQQVTTELKQQNGVSVIPQTPNSGSVTTSDVTLTYQYDGLAELNCEVVSKHSFKAKLASEAEIEEHINAMFAKVLAP